MGSQDPPGGYLGCKKEAQCPEQRGKGPIVLHIAETQWGSVLRKGHCCRAWEQVQEERTRRKPHEHAPEAREELAFVECLTCQSAVHRGSLVYLRNCTSILIRPVHKLLKSHECGREAVLGALQPDCRVRASATQPFLPNSTMGLFETAMRPDLNKF